MPVGKCSLCEIEADLQLSHILPAFAYRWLRDSAGGAHLRGSDQPNRRVQDGLKEYMLCRECEGLFSKAENAFAERLFYPYLEDSTKSIRYSRWLLYFCTSVSWRVLRYHANTNQLGDWTAKQCERALLTEGVWREYLLGKRKNPGIFQQHLLPVDQIAQVGKRMSPAINRYLMRAIHVDLLCSNEGLYTFAKLGRFMIFGFIDEPKPHFWRGSMVKGNEGVVGPRDYSIPAMMIDYWNKEADRIKDSFESMSDRQHKKVDEALAKNLQGYLASDGFTAFSADVTLSGDGAFSQKVDP